MPICVYVRACKLCTNVYVCIYIYICTYIYIYTHTRIPVHTLYIFQITYLLSYSLTYLLTPCSTVLLEKLTGFQLVKKFPAFYGILIQIDPVHAPTSHFLKFHLNIILPSTPGSPQWSLSLRFPHQKPCTRLSPHPYALHAPPISFSIL